MNSLLVAKDITDIEKLPKKYRSAARKIFDLCFRGEDVVVISEQETLFSDFCMESTDIKVLVKVNESYEPFVLQLEKGGKELKIVDNFFKCRHKTLYTAIDGAVPTFIKGVEAWSEIIELYDKIDALIKTKYTYKEVKSVIEKALKGRFGADYSFVVYYVLGISNGDIVKAVSKDGDKHELKLESNNVFYEFPEGRVYLFSAEQKYEISINKQKVNNFYEIVQLLERANRKIIDFLYDIAIANEE